MTLAARKLAVLGIALVCSYVLGAVMMASVALASWEWTKRHR